MTDIVNIISTLGFPIGACMFLAWQGMKQDEKFSALINKNLSVIENNTKAITEFSTKLTILEKGVERKNELSECSDNYQQRV